VIAATGVLRSRTRRALDLGRSTSIRTRDTYTSVVKQLHRAVANKITSRRRDSA
jgi:hypothetical protein